MGLGRSMLGRGRETGSLLFPLLTVALFGLFFAAMTWAPSIPVVVAVLVGVLCVIVCLRSASAAAILLVASMLFSPEFELPNGILLRGEDVIVPLLALALMAQACIPRFRLRFRRSALDIPILVLVVVNAVASLRGAMAGTVDPLSAALWNGKIIELFLIFWLTFNYVRTADDVRRLTGVALFVLVAVALYTYTQIPGTRIHSLHRLTAPFEDHPEPTTLGGYLTLFLAVVMSIAMHEPSAEKKTLYWGMAGIVIIPILFTLSRTTYASCTVMVLLLGIVTKRYRLVLLLAVCLLASPLLLPEKVIGRVLMTFDSSRQLGLDPSFVERITVWNKALYALRTQPLLGYGLPQPILDSQFVRTIVESGALGLTAWLFVLGSCVALGRRVYRVATEPLHKGLAAGYIVGVAAITVHALAAVTFYIVRIMEPFWLLTGIMAFLDVFYRDKARGEAFPEGASAPGERTQHKVRNPKQLRKSA